VVEEEDEIMEEDDVPYRSPSPRNRALSSDNEGRSDRNFSPDDQVDRSSHSSSSSDDNNDHRQGLRSNKPKRRAV